MSRAARFVPVLALAFALTLGLWTLFGPTYVTCRSGTVRPGEVSTTSTCETANLVTVQRDQLFPAPLLWIAGWSLAPALAVIGTRSGSKAFALGMTSLAFAIDAMSIISMGGGFLFALFVSPMLLLTLVLIALSRGRASTALG